MAVTANTVVIRPNQSAKAGDIKLDADACVRRALTMAVDNSILLELGFFRQWTFRGKPPSVYYTS